LNKILRFLLTIVFVFMTFSTPQPVYAAGLCYVNIIAGGTNTGTSWTNAYTSLQTAIADPCTEIWVAKGTYKPHASDRTVSFVLESNGGDGVEIYGGFAGTETLRSQRDFVINVTILSGDLNGNDNSNVSVSEPTRSENSYHVITSGGVLGNSVLDGFTIKGGNANTNSNDYDDGGGMYNYYSNPILANVTFSQNSAVEYGGGIYNKGSNPTLTNITFSGNSASNTGGGVMNEPGASGQPSNPILNNVTFSGNSSGSIGGGMYNGGVLTNVTFSGNSAFSDGGGMYNVGNSPTLTNVTFSGNSATHGDGGGMYNDYNGNATLTNVTFSGNTAKDGGGMNNERSSPTLTNVTFSGNSAVFFGGGVFIGEGAGGGSNNPIFKNVIIANSSSGGDCVLAGTVNMSSSNNLIESTGANACGLTNGANGNIIGSDPNLGTLTGSPAYYMLNTGSPAINAGTNTGCPSTDQRGVTRPQNGVCDIGAYESNAQPGPALVVNTNEDSTDGFCDGYLAGVTDCTLREAITYANSLGGTVIITFAANYTITLGSQLPAVTGTIIINGNGIANTIIQANAVPNTATYRVFQVNASGNFTLNNLTVRHGRCNGACAVSSQVGGGIYNVGTLTINNSLVSTNTAPSDQGGGLMNDGGTVTITGSTFSDNSSYNAGGAIGNSNTTMTISNSTITNNSATGNTAGGLYNSGTLNIYNSTISGNTSSSVILDGDNIYQANGALNLYNTIIANSATHGDCFIGGGTVNATNSLIESTGIQACGLTNGSNGNIIGSDPKLGTLTGTPAYLPLKLDSPAINAGNDTICGAAPINNSSQNGAIRPVGAHCDIGAFEYVPTFSDVPISHPYWLDIEILYANGLTAGCSVTPLNFCPDQIMDRAQSAVFNLRGNFGVSYTPPLAPWDRFADDWSAGAWAERWAEGMYNAGLTAGCATSPLRYCPWDQTPKVQAAVFGLRLKYGNSYVPPAASGTVFADMTDTAYFGTKWSEQAYADGLLPDCGIDIGSGKPNFCPNDLVSRGLGADMIVKAKNLSMP
jgi:CSLREA domain-containing protein